MVVIIYAKKGKETLIINNTNKGKTTYGYEYAAD